MSSPPYIAAAQVAGRLDWLELIDVIADGHRLPRAQIGDVLLGEGTNRLLTRSAWVEGLGLGVKAASVFPGNTARTPAKPSTHAMVMLFDAATGVPTAFIDGDLVTRYKTAADSVLGARLLARSDSRRLLIVGAGAVADAVIEAYQAVFPAIDAISVWNRTRARADALATQHADDKASVVVVDDLASAAANADIIVCATMSEDPVLRGAWVSPGTHVDLIGAYTPTMREADDDLIAKARIFVDARETAVHDIGELGIPLANGVIAERDVLGDLYDLCSGAPARTSQADITLYKNGGGGHLDVMTAAYVRSKLSA